MDLKIIKATGFHSIPTHHKENKKRKSVQYPILIINKEDTSQVIEVHARPISNSAIH